MRFIVTGAGGLLGGETIRVLSEDPAHEVIALSSQPEPALRARWQLGQRNERVRVAEPNTYFEDPLRWDPIDALVNNAWPLNLGGTQLATGLQFHVSLFRATAQAGVRTLINVSSQSVYDAKREGAADESAPLDLDTPYAASKYACELMAEELCPDTTVVQARMSSIIAPVFERRLVNKMTVRAVREGRITIVSPEQVFDFMDARDAARALVLLAIAPPRRRVSVVNVGANAPHSLSDIAELVKVEVERNAGRPVSIDRITDGERKFSSWLDASQLHRNWLFEARYSIRDTVAAVIRSEP